MTQEEREAARLQRREEMKRLLLEGVPVNDIAKQLSAGRATVYQVRGELIDSGELWVDGVSDAPAASADDDDDGDGDDDDDMAGEGEGEAEPTVRVATRYLTALEALLDTVAEVHRLRRVIEERT